MSGNTKGRLLGITALILVKSDSKRLPGKNTLPIKGKPMYMINLRKCLNIFHNVFVSSDSMDILMQASRAGAKIIKRDADLCGDTPNIPVYQHAMKRMGSVIEAIVAVQANSPNIDSEIIRRIKDIVQLGTDEVMTCHPDHSIYGSVWGITRRKLKTYGDPYKPKPEILVVDNSIDIHEMKDYIKAKEIYEGR